MVGQVGRPTKHILASKGPDVDLNRFYSTTSATSYGRQWSKFEPRTTRHTGTGYLSNFRPGVYYSAKLDVIDNPAMGDLIAGNYQSVTHKHYKTNIAPDGHAILPSTLSKQGNTGYVREHALTIPTNREVNDVTAMTRVVSAPAGILPKDIPHLRKVKCNDPLANENSGFGPARMTTESGMQYKSKLPYDLTTLQDCRRLAALPIGCNEDGGYVNNCKFREPLTYQPRMAHRGDIPAWQTNRPTGVTITTTDFRPCINALVSVRLALGNELIPKISENAQRSDGFTKSQKNKPEFLRKSLTQVYDNLDSLPEAKQSQLKKQDPCEYMNAVSASRHPSVSCSTYLALQRQPRSEAELTGTSSKGFKEFTGYSSNTLPYNLHPENVNRFITDNNMNYQDTTPLGVEREGHVYGGVLMPRPNGFNRGSKVDTDTLGSTKETAASAKILRDLNPYAARSLLGRNEFFVDRTHSAKQRIAVI